MNQKLVLGATGRDIGSKKFPVVIEEDPTLQQIIRKKNDSSPLFDPNKNK